MKQFKDAKGREWSLTVNVGAAKRVRDLTKVDLFNIFASEAEKVFSDPVLLVDMLWVLCMDQAKERGVTDENFGESLYGDAIEHATLALMESVADFFPSSRRAILLKSLEKSTAAAKTLEAKAMEALEKIDLTNLQPVTK